MSIINEICRTFALKKVLIYHFTPSIFQSYIHKSKIGEKILWGSWVDNIKFNVQHIYQTRNHNMKCDKSVCNIYACWKEIFKVMKTCDILSTGKLYQ